MHTYCYSKIENLALNINYYPSLEATDKPAILYFHGGGLIYGSRDDLPDTHLTELLAAGYPVLSFDYPFIPEVKISAIIDCLTEGIQWFITEATTNLKLKNNNFIYFGRSAGAYLALLLTKYVTFAQPVSIISFYGYENLADPALTQPSTYYKQFPAVPFMETHHLIQRTPISKADIQQRFPIYLSYRQTGQWTKEILGKFSTATEYSLSATDLKSLPATFLACSTADQDVPVSISKHMADVIPESYLYLVDNLPHDFDSDYIAGIEVVQCLINWLNERNKKS